MPQGKDFKRLVRERMAITGEQYTAARAALLGERDRQVLAPELALWMTQLGDGEHARAAYEFLERLPEETRRIASMEGLRHADWRVRSRSAQLLDNLTLTPETTARLLELLDDEHPRVRAEAFHTLTCEHCKPEACDVNMRAIAGKMVDDQTPSLRRAATGLLSYFFDNQAIVKLRALADDPSPRVRRELPWKLARAERRRTGYEAFLKLPSPLRDKLEAKYATNWVGKWVGVSGENVLSAHDHLKHAKSEVAGLGYADSAIICLVAPRPIPD